MDFMIADEERKDVAHIKRPFSLDIDIGEKNNFELKISKAESKKCGIRKGCFIYVQGTEYGGVITDYESETKSEMTTWGGITFRGMIAKDIIRPPSGQDRREVSGDANDIIKTILAENDAAGIFFTVPQKSSGVAFSEYVFPRYRDKLRCLNRMLASENLRIKIYTDQGASGDPFSVFIEAVPIIDYSESIEYSQNSKVNVHVIDKAARINHLICLGVGELKDRLILDLYLQEDGTIGTSKYFSGVEEFVGIFSNQSAKTSEELFEKGEGHFKKYIANIGVEMNTTEFEFEIGDVIGGRDYDTGIFVKNSVINKILRSDGINTSIEVKVKGETEDVEDEEK